ncbi:hypothetical protein HNV12_00915 [Methanococcoides sp. SA1]|nr:hypothetical protein [Methanococcoides sp. SA1]
MVSSGETKVDLHVHSSNLRKSIKSDVNCLVGRAFDVDLDAFAVTDDKDYFGQVANDPAKYVSCANACSVGDEAILFERGDRLLYLVRGVEYRNKEGHYLIVGGDKEIVCWDDLRDTLVAAKDNGAIVGPAHSFLKICGGASYETIVRDKDLFDFVETFNSLGTKTCNARAVGVAEELNLSGLANSDDHRGRPGSSYTRVVGSFDGDVERDIGGLKRSIVDGDIVGYVEKYTGFFSMVNTFVMPHLRKEGISLDLLAKFAREGKSYFSS